MGADGAGRSGGVGVRAVVSAVAFSSLAILASAFAASACTQGVTPDCSDAQCMVVVEVPEAAIDGSEEGGAMPDAPADAPGPADAGGQPDAHEAGSAP